MIQPAATVAAIVPPVSSETLPSSAPTDSGKKKSSKDGPSVELNQADRKVPPFRWSTLLPSHKQRGFVDNDPLVSRAPEDDIAVVSAYFELMVSAYASKDEKAMEEVRKRASRLKSPSNWVLLLNCFAVRNQKVPSIVSTFETRFLGDGVMASLNAHEVSSLAFAVDFIGGASPAFTEAISKQLEATKR